MPFEPKRFGPGKGEGTFSKAQGQGYIMLKHLDVNEGPVLLRFRTYVGEQHGEKDDLHP